LAVLIAAFNILGVLAVLVADKRAEIAVLTGMGFTPRGILAVFVSLGATIGAIGIALGLAAGLAIAFNVNAIVEGLGHLVGHPLFAAGAIALPGLPSRVDPLQVGLIVVVAAVLVIVAAWVPARRAARLPPARALSGE
ncbi:MAG: ABC transporter permease, partial [Terriglobales bacterium]